MGRGAGRMKSIFGDQTGIGHAVRDVGGVAGIGRCRQPAGGDRRCNMMGSGERTFVMSMLPVRRVRFAGRLLLRVMPAAVHRADGEGRCAGAVRHPAHRQHRAQQHSHYGKMNGDLVSTGHGGTFPLACQGVKQ